MKQLLKFLLVGISSGIVNFLAYNLILLLFGALQLFPNIDYMIGLIVGFIVSVYWSFLLNRKFVFNSPEELTIPWYQALIKMYVTYAFTGVVLNTVLSYLWVDVLNVPKSIITIINDIIGFPVTFLLTKFWSFRKQAMSKLQQENAEEDMQQDVDSHSD